MKENLNYILKLVMKHYGHLIPKLIIAIILIHESCFQYEALPIIFYDIRYFSIIK